MNRFRTDFLNTVPYSTSNHMLSSLPHPYYMDQRQSCFYPQQQQQFYNHLACRSIPYSTPCLSNYYMPSHLMFNSPIVSNPYKNVTIQNKTWVPVEIVRMDGPPFVVYPKKTQRIFTIGDDRITVKIYSLGNYVSFTVNGGRVHCGVGETISSGNGTNVCKFPMSEITATITQCGNIIIETIKKNNTRKRHARKR